MNEMTYRLTVYIIMILVALSTSHASEPRHDTLQADSVSRQLGELVVTAARPGSDVIPVQTLSGDEHQPYRRRI